MSVDERKRFGERFAKCRQPVGVVAGRFQLLPWTASPITLTTNSVGSPRRLVCRVWNAVAMPVVVDLQFELFCARVRRVDPSRDAVNERYSLVEHEMSHSEACVCARRSKNCGRADERNSCGLECSQRRTRHPLPRIAIDVTLSPPATSGRLHRPPQRVMRSSRVDGLPLYVIPGSLPPACILFAPEPLDQCVAGWFRTSANVSVASLAMSAAFYPPKG